MSRPQAHLGQKRTSSHTAFAITLGRPHEACPAVRGT